MKIPFWFRFLISSKQRRYTRYINYWNSRAKEITDMIRADTRDSIQVEMSWLHLIDQEITMWNMLGYVDHFDLLAQLRGFSPEQQQLMKDIIKVMKLKIKPEAPPILQRSIRIGQKPSWWNFFKRIAWEWRGGPKRLKIKPWVLVYNKEEVYHVERLPSAPSAGTDCIPISMPEHPPK